MKERIIMFYSNHKPWFYLITHVMVGVVLVALVMMINLEIIPILDHIPDFLLTQVSLAETILSTLAGAWLSVTTFTFSTTMVVLTTYSSNYSPRVVENFLQNKTTMKVLGTFVGGFIYCISMLFFINGSFANELVLSPLVAILYAFWCIIEFVQFIFSVANAIQPHNLISGLYEETNDWIEDYIEANAFKRSSALDTSDFKHETPLLATESGQLSAIDSDQMLGVLEEYTFQLVVHVQIGDFIRKGQTVATLYTLTNIELDHNWNDEWRKKLLSYFHLSNRRYASLDYRYSIQKIVDVAVRALSPGINDPNTAITAIRSLGLLTGRLSGISGMYDVLQLEKESGPASEIVVENFNLKEDLFLMYSQIVTYGKDNVHVVVELLAAIRGAIFVSAEFNVKYLRAMSDYIYESALQGTLHPSEKEIIDEAKASVDAAQPRTERLEEMEEEEE